MQTSSEIIPTSGKLLTLDLSQGLRSGLPILRAFGRLTEEGWHSLAETCHRMTGALRVLDFTGITHCETTSEDAAAFGRLMARQEAGTQPPVCHLMIAPGDLMFGLCRVVQMNLDMARMKAGVARSVEAAAHWLEQEGMLPEFRSF